jgi:hypothetical protein
MQNNNFKPTFLLVMEHNVTGLKYFCKTTLLDRVYRYKGSGVAWTKHLKEFGRDVTVGVLGFYIDAKRCFDAAKKFTEENDIVNSKEWANLIPETGKNGASLYGDKNPFYGKHHSEETKQKLKLAITGKSYNKGAYRSPEQRAKISAALKGRKNPAVSKALTGRKLSEETKRKISEGGKGRVFSMEAREKIRQAALKQWQRQKNKLAEE